MGSGKTTAMINMLKHSDARKKVIFITPYLSEVERMKTCCRNRKFKEPEESPGKTKLSSLKQLMRNRENIATTHALFNFFDDDIAKLAKRYKYTLIIDEAFEAVELLDIFPRDRDFLESGCLNVLDDNRVEWVDTDYAGRFSDYKKIFTNSNVYKYGQKSYLRLYPIKIFESFRKVYIMTYMFKSQLIRYYFDFFNVHYTYLYVAKDNDTYNFTTDKSLVYYPDYRSMIRICDSSFLNDIGSEKFAMSKAWYKNANDAQLDRVKANIYSFCRKHAKVKSKFQIWTTFKDYKSRVSAKGFTRGFVACNICATNNYADCSAASYLINVFMNPCIKNFFVAQGVTVDEDGYALSELLQWLFRTSVRKQCPIDLYIPSSRMRGLLQNWIDEVCPP